MRPGEEVLKRLYQDEGWSCERIGKKFGVTSQTARNWLIAAGIERRHKANEKYPGDEAVRRLYVDEKLSLNAIARQFSTSASIVSRWLVRAGVQSRSVSEATSLAQTGRPLSEAHKEALRKNAAVARTKITAESRERQRQAMLGKTPPNKGQKMSEEQRQKLVDRWKDPERREKVAAALRGEKSHLWKGGVTPDSSLHGWRWRELRRKVYERDNWTCQDCGEKCLNTKDSRSKPKLKIQAHHKIPRRYGGSDDLDNLVTLCMSCHHTRERGYVHRGV